MKKSLIAKYAAISIVLILGPMGGLNIASAQSPVDYDADDDGLIEIEWLDQLDAIRGDLDGDGHVDDEGNTDAYSAAFPDAAERMGCIDFCRGYELTRDLDFKSEDSYLSGAVNDKWTSGDGWLPVGVSKSLEATFDGNGYAISNLYINRSGANQPERVGLIGGSNGYIARIGLVDISVIGMVSVGGLVGENQGSVVSCFAVGSVSGKNTVGGLIGSSRGDIASSYFDGNVSGEGVVGGLAGFSRGRVTSSYATGKVSDGNMGGGLIGYNEGDITSSHANSTVWGRFRSGVLAGENRGQIVQSYASGDVSGGNTTGGLVGLNESDGVIRFSYASSTVSGSPAGGLIGSNSGIISSSYATGSVSSDYSSGGFVGENLGNIFSSYSTGDVAGHLTGGLAGANWGSIKFSYTISNVPIVENGADAIAGAFVGPNEGEIVASYWNAELSDQSVGVGEGSGAGVESKTTAELQDPTSYTGIYANWLADLDNADGDYDQTTGVEDVWDFGTSGQYPELKADLDSSGHASWWEFGSQHGRPQPTATPTPLPTNTPTPTITPTATSAPTITPTPTQTATATNTPIPTDTLTATPSPTTTPIPTDTPVPTATATHTAVPADTPAPTSTPEPTEPPVPPTQPAAVVVVVVTATPSAVGPSGSGCNSAGVVPAGTAAANLLFVVAPLAIIGSVRLRRRKAD